MKISDMDKAIEARSRWRELYFETGVVSVEGSNGIHLTPEEFFETFSGADITERPRDCASYPYEYSAEYKDVRFFCIGDKREGITNEKGN